MSEDAARGPRLNVWPVTRKLTRVSLCPPPSSASQCVVTKYTWVIPVSFPVYVIAFIAFLGWFFFAIFAGVGFIALPLDLINEFRTRPEPMTTKVYFDERTALGGRTKTLLEIANKLSLEMEKHHTGGKKRQEARDMRNLEKHYFYLKKDFQILTIAYKLRGGNPLVYFAKLFGGIIFLGISLSWWIHIAVYVLPAKPYSPFLNNFFQILTDDVPSFPLFGVLAFALWSFHLLFCVVKGNFRLGVRFLFIKLYPMEIGNTLMNAFLFNTWIILLTAVPAVQFCVDSFPIYTSDTQASVMFGSQVSRGRGNDTHTHARTSVQTQRRQSRRTVTPREVASVLIVLFCFSAAFTLALSSLPLPFTLSSRAPAGEVPHLLSLLLPEQRVRDRAPLLLGSDAPHHVRVSDQQGGRGREDARSNREELHHQGGTQGRTR